ncbi:pirin family protein [Halomonas almeriensis]|uniref:pirin family protein n=1 Tax=Halomonas almeriensis TaxID=308163 RepID=UPI0025B30B2C|nr:pirin family protein [Halomonas almeriensis]MDN3552161.1 pirin family protein [Halomonas almeriensis]
MNRPAPRQVIQRRSANPSRDGDGVAIQRLHDFSGAIDPFLMLDELVAAPGDNAIGGFPPHPHRGIQTLTYVLHGGLRHEDHLGHHSSIRAGAAQWMHTGRGIIHGETPFTDEQGLHAFQIWVNLASSDKLSEPIYRDVQPDEMPRHRDQGAELTALGGNWVIDPETRLEGPLDALAGQGAMAELTLETGSSLTLANSATTLLALVFQGSLTASGTLLPKGEMAIFGPGDSLELSGQDDARALLLAGEPHGEPIAHYGPFVMNHQHELEQAMREYRDGILTLPPA